MIGYPHKAWLPLVLLVLLHTAAKGQPSHYAVGATVGSVIATPGSPVDNRSLTTGFDAALLWRQNDSTLFWNRFWGEPLTGLRFNYARVRNGLAGDRIGLAWTLQGPVAGRLDWIMDVGLSAYTKPYSLVQNPDNIFIGSVLNCLIQVGFSYDLPLAETHTFTLAAKLVHSSNGYLYKPNHGLNFLQLELGMRQGPVLSSSHRPSLAGDTAFTPAGHPFLLLAGGGVMSRYDPIDQIIYYPVYTLQLGYVRHLHPCFSVGGSLDLSYNFSHRIVAPADEWPLYPAAFGFLDTRWGPITLRLGMAHYLAYYPLNWEQYYERVGLYYRLGRHLVGVGMKVHYDHIDYIEWSYGIEL